MKLISGLAVALTALVSFGLGTAFLRRKKKPKTQPLQTDFKDEDINWM